MRMRVPRRLAVAAVVLTTVAVSPAAADVRLTIGQGRVTLVADGVSARAILEEWAIVGGSQIVNAEKLTGPAITVRLEDVPEREALEVILRSAAGYVAAQRPADEPGVSAFNRIIVLAASKAPPAPARSMSAPAPAPFAPPPPVDEAYQPDWPPAQAAEPPDQLRPYPGPFPGTVFVQPPEPDLPPQPQTLPQPGFVPVPQQVQPGQSLPPGSPGAPPTVPPRRPGGGGGG